MSWVVCHDAWISLKSAAKRILGGWWWKTIVKFASIANINHGPLRSGPRGRAKQHAHAHYCDALDPTDAAFRAASRRRALLDDIPRDTELDWAERVRRMNCLPIMLGGGARAEVCSVDEHPAMLVVLPTRDMVATRNSGARES